MYAFVMRPESLPKSFQDFIQKTGPVSKPVYRAVRDCCRGFPVDVASLSTYLSDKSNSKNIKLDEFPSIIPCSVIHPDSSSCLAHNANATSATFRKTFPLYFSLTFVPFVVLHLQKVCFLYMYLFLLYLWRCPFGDSIRINKLNKCFIPQVEVVLMAPNLLICLKENMSIFFPFPEILTSLRYLHASSSWIPQLVPVGSLLKMLLDQHHSCPHLLESFR